MRAAIVSDILGNRRAFQAVLADLREVAPDLVVQGGDLAYGGTHPVEIIDQICALGWPGVRGNTDEMLWAPEGLAEFAAKTPKLGPLLDLLQEMILSTLAFEREIAYRRNNRKTMNLERLNRITIEADKCGGRPCIRGQRICVTDVLELLGAGASIEEILADYPFLEREDILAALDYAAYQTDRVALPAS